MHIYMKGLGLFVFPSVEVLRGGVGSDFWFLEVLLKTSIIIKLSIPTEYRPKEPIRLTSEETPSHDLVCLSNVKQMYVCNLSLFKENFLALMLSTCRSTFFSQQEVNSSRKSFQLDMHHQAVITQVPTRCG